MLAYTYLYLVQHIVILCKAMSSTDMDYSFHSVFVFLCVRHAYHITVLLIHFENLKTNQLFADKT